LPASACFAALAAPRIAYLVAAHIAAEFVLDAIHLSGRTPLSGHSALNDDLYGRCVHTQLALVLHCRLQWCAHSWEFINHWGDGLGEFVTGSSCLRMRQQSRQKQASVFDPIVPYSILSLYDDRVTHFVRKVGCLG
jgi:hypothetical protein